MSRRTEMLASTIQRELMMIIMRELSDPRITGVSLPTITRVKVSPDLAIADVYVTIMGTPGEQTAALNALKHSSGMMRTKLNKALSLRQSPYIKFHIDENLKKELEMLDLLDRVAKENAEIDRQRAAAAAAAGDGDAGGDAANANAANADAAPGDADHTSQTNGNE